METAFLSLTASGLAALARDRLSLPLLAVAGSGVISHRVAPYAMEHSE
jgi:hypothetical protein